MSKLVRVRVVEDFRWPVARVAGREFTKAGEVVTESLLDDEMRGSGLLVIEEIEEKPKAKATKSKAEKEEPKDEEGD